MIHHPLHWVALLFIALCACTEQRDDRADAGSPVDAAASPAPSFDRALAEAGKSQKLVLVDFFTTWCVPCKRLEKETWNDAAVRAWMADHCIDLRIDAEAEPDLARRYHVGGYPTILLLKPDGTEIDRLVGFRDAKQFLAEVQAALAGKSSVQRAQEALVGHENDPMARGRYADELVEAGKYEEALKEYLWCFDEGAESSGYAGVRLSFLLSDIMDLTKKYPPARAALETRRDAAEERVRKTEIPAKSRDQKLLRQAGSDVHDAARLNEKLGTPERLIALYDELRRRGPLHSVQRSGFALVLVEPFLAKRRYQDVLDLFDKPEGYVTGTIGLAEQRRKLDVGSGAQAGPGESEDRFAIEAASQIYEALLGTQQADRASKVADRILAFAPRWPTYVELMHAATRAGSVETARMIGEQGLNDLAGEGLAVMRDELSRLPK